MADAELVQSLFDLGEPFDDSPELRPRWGHVHRGFSRALDPVWPQLLEKIRETQGDENPPAIWITGHSLGAAVGTLLTGRLVNYMLHAEEDADFSLRGLYTFGSPRVGNQHFETELETWTRGCGRGSIAEPVCPSPYDDPSDTSLFFDTQLVRFRQAQDLVTQVPLSGALIHYKHVGRQVFLTPGDEDGSIWYGPASSMPDGLGFPSRYRPTGGDVGDPNDFSGFVPLVYLEDGEGLPPDLEPDQEMTPQMSERWLERLRSAVGFIPRALADHDMLRYYERLVRHGSEQPHLAACEPR